jgi:UDP-glucuronate decarboxylase
MMATTEDLTGPFYIGNAEEFTMLELAEHVVRLSGSSSTIVYRELPTDDPRQRKPDTRLAEDTFGWRASTKLEDGLQRTIAYFRKLIATGDT